MSEKVIENLILFEKRLLISIVVFKFAKIVEWTLKHILGSYVSLIVMPKEGTIGEIRKRL